MQKGDIVRIRLLGTQFHGTHVLVIELDPCNGNTATVLTASGMYTFDYGNLEVVDAEG